MMTCQIAAKRQFFTTVRRRFRKRAVASQPRRLAVTLWAAAALVADASVRAVAYRFEFGTSGLEFSTPLLPTLLGNLVAIYGTYVI